MYTKCDVLDVEEHAEARAVSAIGTKTVCAATSQTALDLS